MAKYVDGFIIVVPDSKVAEYTKMAEEGVRGSVRASRVLGMVL